MATLARLKQALREKANAIALSSKQPLSDMQYSNGFDVLMQGSESKTYQDFIIPQLSQLLAPLVYSHNDISVLEVGPGKKSLLEHLPCHLKRRVRKYTAFEPNKIFAARLEERLSSTSVTDSPLPCLEERPYIHRRPFVLQDNTCSGTRAITSDNLEKYDVILFCHSMYGMKPKHKFVERALQMLVEQPQGGIVVVFHRDTLQIDGLACHRTASFPTGVVDVPNDDGVLDHLAPFIAGFTVHNEHVDKGIREEWRSLCRALSGYDEAKPNHLFFGSPNVMVAFTRHATSLPQLTAQVPLVKGGRTVKSPEARLRTPASVVGPTGIHHVQQCVKWALTRGLSLTVISGGHSDHCLQPNVVAIDMGAFRQIQIITAGEGGGKSESESGTLVVAESGCKTGEIIARIMAAGLTVPLGARPSVGAGLWLQGGIGHLARQYGLACDAIVGAVIVSVVSGQVLCIGHVPKQTWPAGAVRPENELEFLWAIKGAGTSFGIVISITFKAYTAPIYSVRDWIIPLSSTHEAQVKLSEFDKSVASQCGRSSSADAYLYWNNDQLHLGITVFEHSTSQLALQKPTSAPIGTTLGPADAYKEVDSVGLFDTEMYMSGIHRGGGGGKTSSFKRCLFLSRIGEANVTGILVAAIESRPSPLCYFHLLQGGGAVDDIAADATAFGSRNWDFACIVTGVWTRDQDAAKSARDAIKWVYNVVEDLLPLSSGAYGADLGPDPRDAALAARAVGLNWPRLIRLKQSLDPQNVLAHTWCLPKAPTPKLIILVTGRSCAGKDYCANVWASVFSTSSQNRLAVRTVGISDVIKRQYAAATGADLDRLLCDRAYKEHHRPALTAFFQDRMSQRPRLPEEHFMDVVRGAADVDVLLITGMRDEAPTATFSYLVPDSRLLEVRVKASEGTKQLRRGYHADSKRVNEDGRISGSSSTALDCSPCLNFTNDDTGDDAAQMFAEHYLLPFVHADLQRLDRMVRRVANFPHPGIEFHHVLGISQEPDGLTLCTSLLQKHFTGHWDNVGAMVCCEAGGFVFASALASRNDVPLVLIREADKLPPPTVSVVRPSSHISSLTSSHPQERRFEMEEHVVPKDKSVMVVDDVLATGRSLCAVLQLLAQTGFKAEHVSVMVVAEFPLHRGREFIRQHGFDTINIQSLLVFNGL